MSKLNEYLEAVKNKPMFNKGDKVTLTNNIKEISKTDWDLQEGEYEKMIKHIGKSGIIIHPDKDRFEYVTIKFDDGFLAENVSIKSHSGNFQVKKYSEK